MKYKKKELKNERWKEWMKKNERKIENKKRMNEWRKKMKEKQKVEIM